MSNTARELYSLERGDPVTSLYETRTPSHTTFTVRWRGTSIGQLTVGNEDAGRLRDFLQPGGHTEDPA